MYVNVCKCKIYDVCGVCVNMWSEVNRYRHIIRLHVYYKQTRNLHVLYVVSSVCKWFYKCISIDRTSTCMHTQMQTDEHNALITITVCYIHIHSEYWEYEFNCLVAELPNYARKDARQGRDDVFPMSICWFSISIMSGKHPVPVSQNIISGHVSSKFVAIIIMYIAISVWSILGVWNMDPV